MSKTRFVGIASIMPAAGFLWARAASMEGGIAGVVAYAIAGEAFNEWRDETPLQQKII